MDTERSPGGDALRVREERFRLAVDAMLGVLYDWDLATDTVHRSGRMLELIGVAPEESNARSGWWVERVPPEDVAEVQRRHEAAFATGARHLEVEYRVRHRDGHLLWVSDHATIEYDDAGRACRVVGYMVSIDDRKRAEANARFVDGLHPALLHERDPEVLVRTVMRALADHLQVDVALFGETREHGDVLTLEEEHHDGRSMLGVYRASDLLDPATQEAVRTAARLVVDDVTTDPRTCASADAYRARGIGAYAIEALISTEHARHPVVTLVSRRPRAWRADELQVVRDVAARLFPAVTRAHAERALRKSEERLRLMMETSPVAIAFGDSAGRILDGNDAYYRMFGYTREEIAARSIRWHQLTAPGYEHVDRRIADEVATAGSAGPFEKVCVRKDGTRVPVLLAASTLPDRDEHVVFIHDITERERAAEAVRASEARLRLAAEAAGFGTMELDLDTGENRWCATAKRITGIPPDAPTPRDPVDAGIVDPADADRVRAKMLASQDPAGDGAFSDEHRIVRPDGTRRWVLVKAQTYFEGEGAHRRPRRAFGAILDVTERRDAEERLRESDRRKDEFLAMLGHELRNPLAAIRNATELVKLSRDDDPRLRRAHGVLERQSTHMARLIDGLLEVSRIARGKIELERRTLDLREVLEGVLYDRAGELASRGLELEKDFLPTPLWVSADHVRLAQVVDNLVANAIKFTTPPGRITVTARRDGERAVVRVADTGVGIRPEMLSHIFEPFQQDTQDIARTAGGLGLGLALARGLVELHGGTIAARSAGAGAGAELEVRLPLAAPPAPARAPSARPRPPRRRVLVVEDNTDAAQMLRDLLELEGHDVAVAETGPAALDHARAHPPEVVLCDLGLPGMSGYELAQAIRADPSLRDVELVALTGYGQPEDRARSRAAGFDEHLVKPVDFHALASVLHHDRGTRAARS